ncbi:MAG: 2-amino-4-hydroxy-6-hydroxymethyldihydropteridine diphosphokinase [Candidatus Aminicenantes bacterium]|nr:MAG: 2-amino-4-hydroxy-6-hydroxymethyldihydropteridine diphosphokinase [Candidatus Aminicenantes bacterium]
MKYFISLGSNIGEREQNLAQAIMLLKKNGVNIIKKSSIYETSPVGNTEQPWFLNQVLEVQTDWEPRAFLRLVLAIEKRMGRTRTAHKGPRCMDIDILLAEDKIVDSADLNIPHPEMANRNFVLIPLKEIAFDAIHPVLEEKIGDLWRESKDTSAVRPFNQRK